MKSPSNHNRDEERKSSGDKDQKEKSDDGHNDGRGKELKTGTSPAENHGREKKSPRGGSPISFINNKRPSIFNEFFVEMVKMSAARAAFLVCGLLLLNVMAFVIIYMIDKRDGFQLETNDDGQQNSTVGIKDIFLFSLATTTTLGISPAVPVSTFSLLVANVQAIVVQMLLVFVTGVFFTRLSQTKPGIVAAKYAVIGEFNGRPALMVRFLFQQIETVLVDVRFALTYQRQIQLEKGGSFFKNDNLELMRQEANRSRVGGTVVHFIDEDSPLFGQTEEDLKATRATFQLGIFGSERSSMAPAVFIHDWEAKQGDIKHNAKYVDTILREAGTVKIDHARLHQVEMLDTTTATAKTEGEGGGD